MTKDEHGQSYQFGSACISNVQFIIITVIIVINVFIAIVIIVIIIVQEFGMHSAGMLRIMRTVRRGLLSPGCDQRASATMHNAIMIMHKHLNSNTII